MAKIPTIGQEIKRLREEKQLTTQELADKVELSRVAITKYEGGQVKPSQKVITKLAEVFEVNEEYLQFLNMDIPDEYKTVIVEISKAPRSVYLMLGITPQPNQGTHLIKKLFSEIGENEEKHVAFYHQLIERLREYNLDPLLSLWVEYYRGILEFTQQNNERGTEILEDLYNRLDPDLDSELFTTVATKLGREHYVKNRLGQSRDYYFACQSVYEKQGNQLGLNDVFRALVDVYEKEGDYKQSILSLKKALEAVGNLPTAHRADTLLRLGVVYRYGGELNQSLECLKESLAIWQSTQNLQKMCNTQVALSDVCRDSYTPSEALQWSREAKMTLDQISKQIPHESYFHLRGFVECSEGAAYLVGGKPPKASDLLENTRDKYEDIRRIYRTVASHVVSIALRYLAQAYWKAGKTNKAEKLCHETLSELEIGYSSHTLIHRATVLITLGEIYLSQNRLEDLDRMIARFQNLHLSKENPQHYPNLARFSLLEAKIALDQNDWRLAATKFGEAISWALKWNSVLLTHEISPQIKEQIDRLRESNSSQANELANYLKVYCEENNLIRDDIIFDFLTWTE